MLDERKIGSPGRMLIFNGGSSAGKTSLCKAMQDLMPEPYTLLGIDAFWLALPPKQLDLEKVEPEYYSWCYEEVNGQQYFRVKPGPLLDTAMKARYWAVAEYLRRGFNVVADEVIWQFDWILEAAKALAEFDVFLIGVHCDEAELDRRETIRGDRYPGWGKGSQYFAHRNMQYDLKVDTTRKSAGEIAREVHRALSEGLEANALKQLSRQHAR